MPQAREKATTRWKRHLQDLKTALGGGEKHLTQISIRRSIFILSIPMILEMLMESLFGVVDVFFVSKVSIEAVAAVGLTESALSIVYSLSMGISMAALAMVSRRMGEGNKAEAAEAALNALVTAAIISLLLAIPGVVYAADLLRLMGGSEELVATGTGYIRLMLGGNITILLLFLINAIFRGAGDAAMAMRVLWLSNGLNIVLDPIFIFGFGPIPEMGVFGAAVATTLSRGVGVCYQLYVLFFGQSDLQLRQAGLKLRRRIVVKILKLSVGGVGQFLISSASWVALTRIVALYGSEAVAAYTIALRILIFAILPAWGIANAAATLVGQNLGAKQPARAEKAVWYAAWLNAAFLGTVMLLFLGFSDGFIALFNAEPTVVKLGTEALQIISLGYVFYAFEMVIGQSFNGAGDTRTPTLINFFGYWLVQIPLALLLAEGFGLQAKGVFMAISIASVVLAITGIAIFRRGHWKQTEV